MGTTTSKRRQVRSKHPGVKLKKRTRSSGATSWRAHYVDPDTGKEVAKTLSPSLSTKEARSQWAKNLANHLERRRMDRASGARRLTPKPIDDAIDIYLEAAKLTLKQKTIDSYRPALNQLRSWAESTKLRSTADLTVGRLTQLRDHLIRAPRLRIVAGGRRAERAPSDRRRAPRTINRELQTIKTVMNAWRVRGFIGLHRDDIHDALKSLREKKPAPVFFDTKDLRRILNAALAHDRECFTATRDEHRLRHAGTTPRYRPIAPFTAFMLLTGCRRGEALSLEWKDVHLDALDHYGNTVGEIRLRPENVKTGRARTVALEVSPGLRRILATLKLQSGGGRFVFGGDTPYSGDFVDSARARMIAMPGVPKFLWKDLRSTCTTYLTNAPGIFGSAAVFRAAAQLGHSVEVAQKHYLGVVRGIPAEAHDLDSVMLVRDELGQISKCLTGRSRQVAVTKVR